MELEGVDEADEADEARIAYPKRLHTGACRATNAWQR